MKKFVFGALIVLSSAANNSCSDSKGESDAEGVAKDSNDKKFDNTAIEDDSKFAVAAADGGMMEVQLGKLALQNAGSPVVKEFGQMMVDDHGKGNTELQAIAASKSISLPAGLGESNQKKYDDLVKMKGADFDKEYADFMVEDHKKDIEEFKEEANRGKDSAIKNWAASKIGVLEHHLQMAESAKQAANVKSNR